MKEKNTNLTKNEVEKVSGGARKGIGYEKSPNFKGESRKPNTQLKIDRLDIQKGVNYNKGNKFTYKPE